uniref:Reverse transcriptase domain-containing protein n=1 Tax=Tanacetum cinerariifolium TaxID=118510 RepID=A0A6L2NEU9_TANCI|nr:hypothetical protein [Tanacetum cinerariifolium]
MSLDSHATITYTSMSSYEVIVNVYFGMPMDPLDPYAQLIMKAPPSPDYIPGPEAPPSPDYIPGPEYPEYLPPANDVFPAEEQPLHAAVSPTAESPGYITNSEPEMDPEEEDGDNEKSEGDSIDYPTSRGDDDDDDLSKDDADDEDEEESSDSEEEEEEHLALTVPASALHSSISAFEDSDQTEPFEEGETAATPPPFAYHVTARISVRPHILCHSLRSQRASMVLMRSAAPSTFILAPLSRTPPIEAPSLLPIPLPTSSFPLPLLLPSTSCREGILEADMPLRKKARFTTPTYDWTQAPPSPDYIPGPEAPSSPDYIPGPEAPPSPDYIPGPEYPEYLPPSNDVFPAEEQPLPAAVSPTAESPGYIADSKPEMDPEEEDGDDEKSEGDSIEYPTSRRDDDADDDSDDLSKDDADDEDEDESSDSEEEEEEHLALTVLAPALHSSISAYEDSYQTEPFKEGETAATPPPSAYRVTTRISVRPHIHMPFPSELEVERLLAIPTPPLSPVSPTSYLLPPFLMPLPIFTPLPQPPPIILPRTRASMVLMRFTAPSTFILAPQSRTPPIGTPPLESIPKADMPLRKRARFTTPTGGYEVGESSVAAAARQIRHTLTVADNLRAEDRLIGRLRRERRYFCTLSTTYAREVAHSRDYCTQIMDYFQSQEVHTRTLVTQIEALQRDVSTLQGHQIDDGDRLMRRIQHEHAQRDAAPEDGDSCS